MIYYKKRQKHRRNVRKRRRIVRGKHYGKSKGRAWRNKKKSSGKAKGKVKQILLRDKKKRKDKGLRQWQI